jgi:hypothetical protein
LERPIDRRERQGWRAETAAEKHQDTNRALLHDEASKRSDIGLEMRACRIRWPFLTPGVTGDKHRFDGRAAAVRRD